MDYEITLASTPLIVKSTGTKLPILEGWGSSDIEDLDGDVIERSALEDFCAPLEDGWTTAYVDHKHEIANILGKLAYPPELSISKSGDGLSVADLKAGVEVFMENPPAALTVHAVESGINMGFSLGFIPKEYTSLKDEKGRPTGGVQFTHIERREISATTMPANPRAWITSLLKTMRSNGVLPSANPGDDLAYIVKHWVDLEPLDASRLVKAARNLHGKAITLLVEQLLGEKSYATLSMSEKVALAASITLELSSATGESA